ncbi:hypothetical protein [Paracoccus mutanolyticus]|uniref:hypothetical protein n=1 Tax=Paracoccus mutanolyticus TaxID=1499308 RepID=UPI0011AEB39B|nr:hypothetical protein [Paracoccus mutanolyticus]
MASSGHRTDGDIAKIIVVVQQDNILLCPKLQDTGLHQTLGVEPVIIARLNQKAGVGKPRWRCISPGELALGRNSAPHSGCRPAGLARSAGQSRGRGALHRLFGVGLARGAAREAPEIARDVDHVVIADRRVRQPHALRAARRRPVRPGDRRRPSTLNCRPKCWPPRTKARSS